MISLALAVFLQLSAPFSAPPPRCETFGVRLDGTQVTVCDGRVVKVVYVGRTW